MSNSMKHCTSCGELVEKIIPEGDNRHRWVCSSCDAVHYQNPKIVVGCVPERDGQFRHPGAGSQAINRCPAQKGAKYKRGPVAPPYPQARQLNYCVNCCDLFTLVRI